MRITRKYVQRENVYVYSIFSAVLVLMRSAIAGSYIILLTACCGSSEVPTPGTQEALVGTLRHGKIAGGPAGHRCAGS